MTLKDFNKKQLLKMRTAVRMTRALHEKAVKTGKSYRTVKQERRDARSKKGIFDPSCPLCAFADTLSDYCSFCPWFIFEGYHCADGNFSDSPSSILRLTRWEKIIQTEIDARRKP